MAEETARRFVQVEAPLRAASGSTLRESKEQLAKKDGLIFQYVSSVCERLVAAVAADYFGFTAQLAPTQGDALLYTGNCDVGFSPLAREAPLRSSSSQ